MTMAGGSHIHMLLALMLAANHAGANRWFIAPTHSTSLVLRTLPRSYPQRNHH